MVPSTSSLESTLSGKVPAESSQGSVQGTRALGRSRSHGYLSKHHSQDAKLSLPKTSKSTCVNSQDPKPSLQRAPRSAVVDNNSVNKVSELDNHGIRSSDVDVKTLKPFEVENAATMHLTKSSETDAKATKVAARMLARQRARAALNIQRWWRGARVRCVPPHTRRALLVQALFRSKREQMRFARIITASTCLQRRVRQFLAQRQLRRMLEVRQDRAVLLIQSIWRGACSRKKATMLRNSRR